MFLPYTQDAWQYISDVYGTMLSVEKLIWCRNFKKLYNHIKKIHLRASNTVHLCHFQALQKHFPLKLIQKV